MYSADHGNLPRRHHYPWDHDNVCEAQRFWGDLRRIMAFMMVALVALGIAVENVFTRKEVYYVLRTMWR